MQTEMDKPLKFVLGEIRRRFPEVLAAMLFLAISTGLFLLMPKWAANLMELLGGTGTVRDLLGSLSFGLAVFTIATVTNFAKIYLMTRFAFNVTSDMRLTVFRKILDARPRNIDATAGSSLISSFSNDLQVFLQAFTVVIAVLVPSLVSVLIFAGAMIWYNWILFICLAVFVSPLVFVTSFFGRALRNYAAESQTALSHLLTRFSEITSSAREIKSLNLQTQIASRFSEQNTEALKILMRRERTEIAHPMLLAVTLALALVGLIFTSYYMISQGLTDAENLTAFLVCLGLAYPPLQESGHAIGRLSQLVAIIDRLNGLMQIDTEQETGSAPVPAKVKGGLQFENLYYSHTDDKDYALTNLNFEIKPGETVAIIGRSGAGKTTLFELLSRFIEPSQGRILLDGTDIRAYGLNDYRAHIGVVFQQPAMFEETLLYNLKVARPGASDKDVRRAAEIAHAAEFIEKLPQKYDTLLEKNGTNLSVGQVQRVAIARLFLKDPEILLLDEPTSALDQQSEAKFNAALNQVSKHRTTLIIAHRPSTVAFADKILVLERGQIEQFGTHAELLQSNAFYREFFNNQGETAPLDTPQNDVSPA